MLCPDMKKISLSDIVDCLENRSGEVKVPEAIRAPALKAVRGMLDLAR
jgi:quinolinate synthase